jgi:peroxin-1
VLRVIPLHLLGLPFPEHTGPEVLAYVSPATFSLLHPESTAKDAVYHKTLLKRLPPPADPSAAPTAAPAPPTTRVLKAGNAEAGHSNADDSEIEELYVRGVESVPESHVAFFPVQGIEEWDLVRYLTFNYHPSAIYRYISGYLGR